MSDFVNEPSQENYDVLKFWLKQYQENTQDCNVHSALHVVASDILENLTGMSSEPALEQDVEQRNSL